MNKLSSRTPRWQSTCGLLLICLSGCDANPFKQVPISGTVTYEDGTSIPAERLQLWFASEAPAIDQRTHPRPGSAIVSADGSFDRATTHKYGDGLIQGKHKVFLDVQPEQLVPEAYRKLKTTPIMIDTKDAPLELKIPRPDSSR